jgi:hypothetical protein
MSTRRTARTTLTAAFVAGPLALALVACGGDGTDETSTTADSAPDSGSDGAAAGTTTWDVQLDEDTADELTVTVDAATGEVVGTERDD